MSVRLEAAAEIGAPIERVWRELVDWPGQARWIPFTTVRATSAPTEGLGVRVVALSGFRLGRIPVGLLDNFVVTGWTPPDGPNGWAELEVLHLGPYFTGEGAFRLHGHGATTSVRCVELFGLPLAPVTEPVGRLLLPLMQAGFGVSLRRLGVVCAAPS